MNIIEELKYYCNISQPVGALMLTGEWGCGKTYLIKNKLKEELRDTHAFLIISLFGIESIQELKNEVKRCWLYALSESKMPAIEIADKIPKLERIMKAVSESISEFIPEKVKTISNGVFSFNAFDFVNIKPDIGNKKVILVFDDLERANILTGDLLGCINDYCENLHINTIVVANEEKIKSDNTENIKYDEIKEKIIQRTLHYTPDYLDIILNVIHEASFSVSYKNFLKANKDSICNIFSGSFANDKTIENLLTNKYSGNSREEMEIERQKIMDLLHQRPHNIRSLKCALQDFQRIYEVLDEKQIPKKEKWLFSFFSYVLSFRAGLIQDTPAYGSLFSEEKLSILYSGVYDSRYITTGIKEWIRNGEWKQEILDTEFDYVLRREKAVSPEEKVRTNRLLDLEENDVNAGFPVLLQNAYSGCIELSDYVNILYNYCWSRKYKIPLPAVDWNKICEGIYKCIHRMQLAGEAQPQYRAIISEEDKKYFLPQELCAYNIIDEFLNENVLMFDRNRKLYIDLLKTESISAWSQLQNKRFNRFDKEMADVTMESFSNTKNADKNIFIEYFKKTWSYILDTQDFRLESSEDGFSYLKDSLLIFRDQCNEKELFISVVHANDFIHTVESLIDKQASRFS